MASDANGLAALPAWARVVAMVGVPSALCLYLVYAVTSFATAGVTESQQQLRVSETAQRFMEMEKARKEKILIKQI